jgi:hypothetical protein
MKNVFNVRLVMKPIVLALACSLISALPGAAAQDLNRLELGIHDLAEMKTLSGVTLVFDPTKIIMIYVLPRSPGRGLVTHVLGLAGGAQEIDEPAESFLERLHLKPYFVALTLPDGAPVSVKASAISFLRAIQPWDHSRAEAKSAVNTGGRPIFVKEEMATIKDAINAIRRQNRNETQHK